MFTSEKLVSDLPHKCRCKNNVHGNCQLRIKNVLPVIIHHNQTGYVKDCFIDETIWSIFDIMDFAAKENILGLMIFIDFKKAFDSVEWD